MKTRRRFAAMGLIVLLAACGWSGRVAAQRGRGPREAVVGAWQLESRLVRKANGETVADPVLGQRPAGSLFYDASGHMMLQMMRQGRVQAIGVPADPQDAKNPRVVLGYDAYFGTFTIDEQAGTITHHVEGSLFPEDLGRDFTRNFTIDGDIFTLSFTSPPADGALTRTLRFRRR